MKRINSLIISALFCISLVAQAPEIEWQNTIGGNGADYLHSVHQTSDGGYILGGYSSSTNTGDKTEVGSGFDDYWVVKIDSAGVIEWQNTIGGSEQDRLYSVHQTIDGGYILGGYSPSPISGDKTDGSNGANDYWIIKLDSLGIILWQKTIGGSSNDLFHMEQTTDGGYILAGSSNSDISGDKTELSFGGTDYWIVKLDDLGNISWQKTIGGSLDDGVTLDIKQTFDGGYILGGSSNSDISGNKTEVSIGGYDYWVIKLDSIGSIQWQNTIGGNLDDYLLSVGKCSDSGFILGGYSYSSISGNKTEASIGPYGYLDYWVLKLDSLGEIIWQNTIGGDYDDALGDIQQTFDGGYILGGISTSSISGDKTEANYGQNDYWVIKLDTLGNINWQKTLGGNSIDVLLSIEQTIDGGFILGGYSNSEISGNKTEGNIGEADYWILKLAPEDCVSSIYYADADGDGYGDLSTTVFACTIPAGFVTDSTDCNDTNSLIHPWATEICNGLDDNCNVVIDDGLPFYTYYFDADADGYGDIATIISLCYEVAPEGYVTNNSDCDDSNNFIHPGALEICNNTDDNCNAEIDEGLPVNTFYADADSDGFGNILIDTTTCFLEITGYVFDNTDCDDSNNFIHPGASEICNALDDNCNEAIDEGLPVNTFYVDADYDGYGNDLVDSASCFLEIAGYVFDNTDCDDTNPDIYPGAEEILNGLDDNCNESVDEGFVGIQNLILNPISIYPNPNGGSFSISFKNIDSEKITIDIFSLIGEKIYTNNIISEDEITLHLPTSIFGIINIVVKTDTGNFSEFVNIVRE